jgi:hypothetical protein
MPVIGLELIDQLGLSEDDYVILGSAAAIAHGMDKTNSDLDILVKESIGVISFGILDIGDGKFDGNLSKEYIFSDSVIIDGYRYMGINSLCEFYRTLSEQTGEEKHVETYAWVRSKQAFITEFHNRMRINTCI